MKFLSRNPGLYLLFSQCKFIYWKNFLFKLYLKLWTQYEYWKQFLQNQEFEI